MVFPLYTLFQFNFYIKCLIIGCGKVLYFFISFFFFYLENLLDRSWCKWMIGKLICTLPDSTVYQHVQQSPAFPDLN